MRRWEILFSNNIINNLRHKKYEEDLEKKKYLKKMNEIGRFTRFITKFRSMFTKTHEFEPDNLTDKKFKNIVDGFKSSRTKISKIEKIKKLPTEEKDENNNNNFGFLQKNEFSKTAQGQKNSNASEMVKNKINNNPEKYDYDYEHPYDDEIVTEHLGGKFKPLPLKMNMEFDQNDSLDVMDDYKNLRTSKEKVKVNEFSEDFSNNEKNDMLNI